MEHRFDTTQTVQNQRALDFQNALGYQVEYSLLTINQKTINNQDV